VLEALSKSFRSGLPWELLYADDLGAQSEKGFIERFENGKKALRLRDWNLRTFFFACEKLCCPIADYFHLFTVSILRHIFISVYLCFSNIYIRKTKIVKYNVE